MTSRTTTRGRGGSGAGRWLRRVLRTVWRAGKALRNEFGRKDPAGSYRVGPKGAALIGPSNVRRPGARGGGLGGAGRGAESFAEFQRSRPDLFGDARPLLTPEERAELELAEQELAQQGAPDGALDGTPGEGTDTDTADVDGGDAGSAEAGLSVA